MKLNKLQYKFNGNNISVFIRDDVDFSVFNEIFKYREYKSCENVLKNSKNGVVVDIGAHAGFFSIYSYCLNKNIKIYAIEPEKNNLEYLSLNKKENKINNIKIIEGAITKSSGYGKLAITDDSINNYVLSEDGANINFQNIKTFSLKDFFSLNKIDRVLLLKLDIEGGEYEIFENISYDTINKVDNIILEYHLKNKGGYDQIFLEKILRNNGFSVQLFPSGFDKTMGFILARNKRDKVTFV